MKLLLMYFDHNQKKLLKEVVDESGKHRMVLSTPENFFSRGEIICRVVDVDNPEDVKRRVDSGYEFYNSVPYFNFKRGAGIIFDEQERAFRAEYYGFVVLDQTKALRVLTPLQITKDKTKAYFFICPTKQKNIPGIAEVKEVLAMNKIVASVSESTIEDSLESISLEKRILSRVLVAESKAPVKGRKEYFTPIIEINKKAGKVLADGSIDFREIDSIIQVTKNEEILKRFPEIKAVNGYDIYGDKINAEVEIVHGYQRGENIVQSYNDENIFVAGIDGCLEINKKRISIKSIAIIPGDVDYNSGNIDFNGSVHVKGAVLPGFSVKADGDIIIEKNVDDAFIECSGNLKIKMGIAGKGSAKIKAGGSVKAKYILNADIEAEGEVVIDDSIINSKVFSNNFVEVSSEHGKIMGGEIIAKNYIVVNTLGSHNETATSLLVGRNLLIEREINQVKKETEYYKENVKEIMGKVQQNFGTALFENPKKFIAVLPALKKKQCLDLLADLSKNNKELKELNLKAKEIEEKLTFEIEPYIQVNENVFPGAVINIKKLSRKVTNPIKNAKFIEDKDNKVIRFVSAV